MTAPVRQIVDGRNARGPGSLLCDVCGYDFDPLRWNWVCPHCATAWPWTRNVAQGLTARPDWRQWAS